MARMAILVDGGFYLKRSKSLKGVKTPSARAEELVQYCKKHTEHEGADLYRIFYYDCDPIGKKAFHPFLRRTIDLSKSDDFKWKTEFFKELAKKRKLAIRKGEALEGSCEYVMNRSAMKDIATGKRDADSLTEKDFCLDVQQKGVDVRIGLDVALIAHEKFADQIVLITGDSDFVPAAKYARRHGIDFIIDPMWHNFRDGLGIHVDGMYTPWANPKRHKTV
ncbi:NYN domain-containing protein [uncultured Ellagibacter sp.]|uniref:NYN domain-containing protein n=1 Tax=uncultured Ellagibacter sp. TaxID=2137580 RepID=UPI002636FB35|nr:NYN domain-containing protein [uncultured Ellagibacter sp.]